MKEFITLFCFLLPAVCARLLIEHLDGTYHKSDSSIPVRNERPEPSVSPLLDPEEEKYVVKSLPGLNGMNFPTKQWAGQIPIPYAGEDHYGGLFFWLFEPNVTSVEEKAEKPLIVWLNGGPGCSSLDGLFIEVGPFRVMPNKDIAVNHLSWHNEGYLLFIDQPIGTGYSYVNRDCKFCDYVHNQSAVNSHMYSAMQSLFVIFPFLKEKDVIIAGESYAGHYIPALTDYFGILNNEEGYSGRDEKINVVSVAIGNGWSIPKIQYNFGSYANNIGILSAPESKKLEKQYRYCVKQVDKGDYSAGGACNIIGQVLAASGACPIAKRITDSSHRGSGVTKRQPMNGTCYGPLLNYYDTRSYYVNLMSNWPSLAERTVQYLNQTEVKKAVHIKMGSKTFSECDGAGQYLMVLYGLGVQPQLINILERGVSVTFYNGQYDFVCNHIGTETMLDQLPWSGRNDFMSAAGYVWVLNETSTVSSPGVVEKVPAGYGRSTSNGLLTFLVVIGGSHMVPMDVPQAASDLIRRIVRKMSFSDFPQEIELINDDSANTLMMSSGVDDSASNNIPFVMMALGSTVILMLAVTISRRLKPQRQYSYSPISSEP